MTFDPRRSRWLSALLDLALPPRCSACDGLLDPAEEAVYCAACSTSLVQVERPCPRCGEPWAGALCRGCREHPPPFASARAPFQHGGQLALAVARLKYQRQTQLARPLAELLLPLAGAFPSPDLVAPVPLHSARLRARGFNQAALLARPVARSLGATLACGALRRERETPSQAGKDRARRLRGVEGAFRARASIRGKSVLLIDDVMTTGATAAACARALRAAGARRVDVLTVARTAREEI